MGLPMGNSPPGCRRLSACKWRGRLPWGDASLCPRLRNCALPGHGGVAARNPSQTPSDMTLQPPEDEIDREVTSWISCQENKVPADSSTEGKPQRYAQVPRDARRLRALRVVPRLRALRAFVVSLFPSGSRHAQRGKCCRQGWRRSRWTLPVGTCCRQGWRRSRWALPAENASRRLHSPTASCTSVLVH